jgi:hypothetical protein
MPATFKTVGVRKADKARIGRLAKTTKRHRCEVVSDALDALEASIIKSSPPSVEITSAPQQAAPPNG